MLRCSDPILGVRSTSPSLRASKAERVALETKRSGDPGERMLRTSGGFKPSQMIQLVWMLIGWTMLDWKIVFSDMFQSHLLDANNFCGLSFEHGECPEREQTPGSLTPYALIGWKIKVLLTVNHLFQFPGEPKKHQKTLWHRYVPCWSSPVPPPGNQPLWHLTSSQRLAKSWRKSLTDPNGQRWPCFSVPFLWPPPKKWIQRESLGQIMTYCTIDLQ